MKWLRMQTSYSRFIIFCILLCIADTLFNVFCFKLSGNFLDGREIAQKDEALSIPQTTGTHVFSIDILCEECKAARVGRHFSCVERMMRRMARGGSMQEAQTIVSGEYSECSACNPSTCDLRLSARIDDSQSNSLSKVSPTENGGNVLASIRGLYQHAPATGNKSECLVIIMAMMLVDGASITDPNAQFLAEMTCSHGVEVHILVKKHSDELIRKYTDAKEKLYQGKTCDQIDVEDQPREISMLKNRLKRIRRARDYQREQIRRRLVEDMASTVIIVVDLDLVGFEPEVMIEQAKAIHLGLDNVDALCAIGSLEGTPPGYYDAFATVLLPDTFLYPPRNRLNGAWPEEDKSIRWALNKEAQWKVYQWIIDQGESGTVPVPVRSCFGGIGIYRGPMWLNSRCNYSHVTPQDMKYADKSGLPCEHVVMHNCMRSVDPNFTIAIHPKLKAIRSHPL